MEILETAVESWGEANAPLIFKAEEYVSAQDSPYSQGFVLLQEPRSYVKLADSNLKKGSAEWRKYAVYGKGNHITGKFIDMPSYDEMTKDHFSILFTMEQALLKNIPDVDMVIEQIASAANHHGSKHIMATKVGKSRTIRISCNKIALKSNVDALVEELDFILSLVKVIV